MINAPFTVFVTAWHRGKPLHQNLQRMALLAQELTAHTYQWELCTGVYEHETEQSFAVQVHDEATAKRIARHVGYLFEQECVGLLDNAGKEFRLVYPSTTRSDDLLGKFKQVTELAAVTSPGASCWRGMWWVAE